MPFLRPTLSELRDQVQQDIDAAPIGLAGWLRNAIVPILGWAQAGLAYLHYAYLDWIAKQAVPWTATDEYLFGWAALKGVQQKDATFASGTAAFTGATPGITVDVGTLVNIGGQQYATTAAATVDSGGNLSLSLLATVAGSASTITTGAAATFASPVAGVPLTGTATAGTGGEDQETLDALRTRMLGVYAAPPQGGDLSDYVEWALGVSGVTRAWANPNGAGAGTVVVYPMFDVSESAHNGFPQGTDGGATSETRTTVATGDQLTVANAIFPLQPVTALVTVASPVSTPVNFTIANLGSNNTTAMQALMVAALEDMFLRLANVGGTLDPATMAAWDPIDPSDWYEALGAIPGLSEFTVTAPNAPLAPTAGQLFVLGTMTYSS